MLALGIVLCVEISSLFSPRGGIYGLVHVGRQPEREICGQKRT